MATLMPGFPIGKIRNKFFQRLSATDSLSHENVNNKSHKTGNECVCVRGRGLSPTKLQSSICRIFIQSCESPEESRLWVSREYRQRTSKQKRR